MTRSIGVLLFALAALCAAEPYRVESARAASAGIPVNAPSDDFGVLEKRQHVLVKDPKIFGLDMLGWGVNGRTDPFQGITMQMYPFAFTEGNEYNYPLEPETTFRVPDEVYVRTVAEQVASAYYFINTYSYVEMLNLNFGIAVVGTGSSSGSTNLTTSQDVDASSLSGFTGNLGISYTKRKLDTNSYIVNTNSLDMKLWQIVIGPALKIRDSVQTAIDAAISNSDAGSDDASRDLPYFEFLDRHGTHFIESVIVGGKLDFETITSKATGMSSDEVAFYANVQFNKMFGLVSKLAVNFTLDYESKKETFERQTTNKMDVKGGDPDLANFFGSPDVDAAALFVDWSKSLVANPAVTNVRLRSICWLFGAKRTECEKRQKAYLKNQAPF